MENSAPEKDSRMIQRFTLQLPARIIGKEAGNEAWQEITHIQDVSAYGAAFNLQRSVNKGQLLDLTSPIPQKLRCYDYFETNYKIWTLVRRVEKLPDSDMFAVGIAFIGKTPPPSYLKNPALLYEISERKNNGLWDVIEADREESASDNRKDSRLQIPINVIIERYDDKGNLIESESAVTENISFRGASVFSTLKLSVGSFVRLNCPSYNTSILAIVHVTRLGKDGFPRLHLEFIDQRFPLDIS
jgi:PilZ domain